MRVLVTASSRHGATAEIASGIAGVLGSMGVKVDELSPDQVADLSDYDAAVIGSAVYLGDWMGAAKQLLTRREDQLRGMPVWLFSSGRLGDPRHPSGETEPLAETASRICVRGHAVFPGRLSRDRPHLGERAITTVVHAPYGDYRNWSDIRAWARGIADALLSGAADPSPEGAGRDSLEGSHA